MPNNETKKKNNFASYNNSEKHHDNISRAHAEGKYDENKRKLGEWNKSEEHRKAVAASNADPKNKFNIQRNKILVSIKFMLLNDKTFSEENWDNFKKAQTPKLEKITDFFANLPEAIEYVRDHEDEIKLGKYKANFENARSHFRFAGGDVEAMRSSLSYEDRKL